MKYIYCGQDRNMNVWKYFLYKGANSLKVVVLLHPHKENVIWFY